MFWRTFVFAPLIALLILLPVVGLIWGLGWHTKDMLKAIAIGVSFLAVLWFLVEGAPASLKKLKGTLLVAQIKAVKQKFCPIVTFK